MCIHNYHFNVCVVMKFFGTGTVIHIGVLEAKNPRQSFVNIGTLANTLTKSEEIIRRRVMHKGRVDT